MECNFGLVDIFPLAKPPQEVDKRKNLFLLETSGRAHLNPRQACAVESAAR